MQGVLKLVLNIRTAGEQSTFYQTPLDRQKEGILNEFEIFPSIFPPLYSDENTSRGDREILPSASSLHSVHCTLYTVHHTLYIVQCTVYPVHSKLYNVHCTLSIAHCILYSTQFTLNIILRIVDRQYTVYNDRPAAARLT